jgi:hypothetical protein
MTSLNDFILVRKDKSASVPGGKPLDNTETKSQIAETKARAQKTSLALTRPIRGRVSAPRRKLGLLPPRLNTTPTLRHVFRFVTTSGSSGIVSVDSLAHALGGIVVVDSTTMTPWSSSSRIHSITVWPSASSSSESTAGCLWASGSAGQMKDEELSETVPQGTTVTGPLFFVPPAKSLASDWLIHTLTANLMTLFAPAGSVIDLDVSFTLKNNFGADDQSVSAGILGSVDYGHLDTGQTIFEPVGVPF